MPIPSWQLQKKLLACREAEGLVTELWSLRIVTVYILIALWCDYCKLSVVWKRGCQPFSWPHSQNGTHSRKEICSTCLFKESIPAFPFWNSKHPLPARSLRFLRAEVRSAISSLWLHHVHPFVTAVSKRPVSCREAEGFVTELFSPRFVTTQWLCSQLCYVTAANQQTFVQLELLATVGWKCGCQLQMPAKWGALSKRDLFDMFV